MAHNSSNELTPAALAVLTQLCSVTISVELLQQAWMLGISTLDALYIYVLEAEPTARHHPAGTQLC